MKKIITVIATLTSFVVNANAQQSTLKITEGTILRVKSLEAISSKTAGEGDMVNFALFEDLQIKGKTVLKEGTIVQGFIETSEKARGIGKEGNLRIQFNSTKAVDGSKVPLRSTKGTIEGESKSGTSVGLAVVVSPLFLLKKGREAKIPEGKIMEAYVARDVDVTVN